MKVNLTTVVLLLSIHLLLVTSLHLHLKSQQMVNFMHRVIMFHKDQQSYVNILKSQQQSITKGIFGLKQVVNDTLSRAVSEKDIDKKISMLEEAINKQRKQVQVLQSRLIRPLSQQQWSCPQLPSSIKQDILNSISTIDSSLSSLQGEVNALNKNDVPVQQTLKKEIEAAKNSTKAMNSAINTDSSGKEYPSGQRKTIYQPNINAKNWYLGGKTKQQLDKQFKNNQDNYNQVITCPYDQPYTAGQSCFECSGDRPYFNIDTNQCTGCQDYDNNNKLCKDKIVKTITNLDIDNTKGNQLILIPNNKTINDYIQERQRSKGNNGIEFKSCPSEKPFFNGSECMSCGQGLLFSIEEKNCQTCPQGKAYNRMSYHCEDKGFFSRLDDTKWVSKNPMQAKTESDYAKSQGVLSECPLSKPYSIGKQCVACGSLQYFNVDSKSCESCPDGVVFDDNLHKCLTPDNNYHLTNPKTANNLIFDGISKNEWMNNYYQKINKYDGIADCPQRTPYYDGKSCINCSGDKPYFNMVYQVCQKCQDQTQYDSDAKECLTTSGQIAVQRPTIEKMGAGIFT